MMNDARSLKCCLTGSFSAETPKSEADVATAISASVIQYSDNALENMILDSPFFGT